MATSYNIPGLSLLGVANPFVVAMVTDFSVKYVGALSAPGTNQWSDEISGMTPTDALVHRFVVDVNDLDGFREWIGDRDTKRTDLTGFLVQMKKWERSRGIDVNLATAGSFAGFPDKVSSMMLAARAMRNRIVANVLIQGKTKALTYQGIPLFVPEGAGTLHYFNPLDPSKGTFFNVVTGMPFNETNLAIARQMLNDIKAPNGVDSLELDLTHVLGGTKMRELFRNVLEREMSGGVQIVNVGGGAMQAVGYQQSNIYRNQAKALIGAQLDSDPVVQSGGQVWYAMACNQEARPIETIAKNGGVPKITIFGEGSEHCEKTDEILVMGKMMMNGGAAFPQTIIRFEG